MSSISSAPHSGVVRDFPVGAKPLFVYRELAISLSAKTQSVICVNPRSRFRSMASLSALLPNPRPAESGSTYREKRWPREESSLSLPMRKTATAFSLSIRSKVCLSSGNSMLFRHNSAALSSVKEFRALSDRTDLYEIVQQRRNISAITGRSSTVAARNSMMVIL